MASLTSPDFSPAPNVNDLTILYVNATGLQSVAKLNKILRFAADRRADFVFVAETWFGSWDRISNHACFLGSTANPTQAHHSRPQGGLAMFANPTHHRRVRVIGHTSYSLVVSIDGVNMAAVYLPPSLSSNEIDMEFHRPDGVPMPQLVFGDVNVRYGKRFGDVATAPERREQLARHTSQLYLAHLLPTAGKTRVDHVFAHPTLGANWSYVQSPQDWHTHDHGVMLVNLTNTEVAQPRAPAVPVRRFRVKELDKPMVPEALCAQYNSSSPIIDRYLDRIEAQHGQARIFMQTAIDSAYHEIVTLIGNSAEAVIGSYVVAEVQRQPDNLLNALQENDISIDHAIRIFKRSQRVHGPSLMVSRDSEISPQDDALNFYKAVYQSIDGQVPAPDDAYDGPDMLSTAFDEASIARFFVRYPLARSCGSDGLHTRLLRPLMESDLCRHLARFFQLCAKSSTTPQDWNTSTVFPIPKIPNARFVNDFRPVALTLMFRRCFEKILFQTLVYHDDIKDSLQLHFTQGGFQRNQSCIQLLLSSHDQHAVERGDQIFIDLKQAYDRVDLRQLLRKLQQRRVPTQVISLLMSLFSRCKNRILVNGELTAPLELLTGLFQGSILSPLLWNIYVDDLAEKLSGKDPVKNPRARFFADDLKLQYGRDRPTHCKQQDLDTVFEWTVQNNMIAGINKCAIVKRDKDDGAVLMLGGDVLPTADSYKYLGMENDRSGVAFEPFIERSFQKARGVLTAVENHAEWRSDVKLAIYKTFIRSRIEYGAGLVWTFLQSRLQAVVGEANKKQFQTKFLARYNELHMSSLQWILGVSMEGLVNPRNVSASLAAMAAPEDRLSDLAAMLSGHLAAAPDFTPTSQQWSLRTLPHSPTLLQPYVRRHPVVQAHRLANIAAEEPVSLRSFVRTHRRTAMRSATYGKMAQYSTTKARSASGMDFLLTRKRQDGTSRISHSDFKKALAWRRGRFGPGTRCKLCDQPFNRGHKHDNELDIKFPEFTAFVALERRTQKNEDFHLLDSLLNGREYDKFALVFNWLTVEDKENTIKRLRPDRDFNPQNSRKKLRR